MIDKERTAAALRLLEEVHDDRSRDDAVSYRAGFINAAVADAMFGPAELHGPPGGPRTLQWLVAGGVYSDRAPDFAGSLTVAYGFIPRGWYLHGLCEVVQPITYAGDRYDSTGKFRASLQHRGGGRLRPFQSATPSLALTGAVLLAETRDG